MEEEQNEISMQSSLLGLSARNKEFSQGLSKAELRKKRANLEKQRAALSRRYSEFIFELPPRPDFSGMTQAQRAETAEKLRTNELRYARRLTEEGDPMGRTLEAFARILDFDPKQGGRYYNRYTLVDLTKFDLDEEYCPNKNYTLCGAVNFLSVKVASSDIGFPIHVYGTVIVRDSIDERCVYHFRRDSDHCQLITSQVESLILTGPKRGLALCGDMHVEIDLKIKDHRGQLIEFSKGLLNMGDPTDRASMVVSKVENPLLPNSVLWIDVTYAAVNDAIEGFIAVEVLQGGFNGKITAYTTSVQDMFVLYDSKEADAMAVEGCGDIQLMRPVVSVHVKEELKIVVQTSDGNSRCIPFSPMINGRDNSTFDVGATKMHVKLAWSVMNP